METIWLQSYKHLFLCEKLTKKRGRSSQTFSKPWILITAAQLRLNNCLKFTSVTLAIMTLPRFSTSSTRSMWTSQARSILTSSWLQCRIGRQCLRKNTLKRPLTTLTLTRLGSYRKTNSEKFSKAVKRRSFNSYLNSSIKTEIKKFQKNSL